MREVRPNTGNARRTPPTVGGSATLDVAPSIETPKNPVEGYLPEDRPRKGRWGRILSLFSGLSGRLRERCVPMSAAMTGMASTQAPPKRTERAMAALWQNAHVLSGGLVTEDGRRVRVAYPGRRSR